MYLRTKTRTNWRRRGVLTRFAQVWEILRGITRRTVVSCASTNTDERSSVMSETPAYGVRPFDMDDPTAGSVAYCNVCEYESPTPFAELYQAMADMADHRQTTEHQDRNEQLATGTDSSPVSTPTPPSSVVRSHLLPLADEFDFFVPFARETIMQMIEDELIAEDDTLLHAVKGDYRYEPYVYNENSVRIKVYNLRTRRYRDEITLRHGSSIFTYNGLISELNDRMLHNHSFESEDSLVASYSID